MGTRRRQTAFRCCALAALIASCLVATDRGAVAQILTAVVSDSSNVTIKLEPIATLSGLVPIDGAAIAGDERLYVGTYIANSASVRVVDPVSRTVSPTPFLTFSGTGVPITGQGLQGITFSPNFNDNTQPGYRKFYTFQVETDPGVSSVMFRHPDAASPTMIGALREWTANSAGTAIDASIASRVVFNFDTRATHMGGGLKFGPDGYLYLAIGDGGGNGNGGSPTASTDGFTGRDPVGTANDVPGISNGQDFTNVLGKVIRIDPYVTNADGSARSTPEGSTDKVFNGSTRYFIPDANPFVGNPQNVFFTPLGPVGSQTPVAPLAELYAIGFRNPWKLSFDKNAAPGDAPYVADVGANVREEIVRVESGKNYAWPYREGDIASGAANGRPFTSGNVPYLKQTSPGVYAPFDLDPTFSDPTQMPLPVVLLGTQSISGGQFWDRPGQDYLGDGIYGDQWGDTNTVTGGFIYRGAAIPELEGMYVFGGYQFMVRANTTNYNPASRGGRLFYFDPHEVATYKTVREFNFLPGFGITPNGDGDLLSVSEGDDGELYAMFFNGDVKRLAPAPLAGDYNNNGTVDAADYTIWRDAFGLMVALPNETESLGMVDEDDYSAWKSNFGVTRGGGGGSVSAPEPAAALLIFIGGSMLCLARLPRRGKGRP